MARHAVADATIKVTSFLGGTENQIADANFRGGRVFAVLGGADIDLRGATLAEEGATLNIVASLGGVRLLIPPDWAVNVQTNAFFGGVASRRAAPATPAGLLTLTGFCLVGGVEIRS